MSDETAEAPNQSRAMLRKKVGSHLSWVGPLVAALLAVTHDYVSSMRNEQQNTLVLRALGSKLNALSNEVSYMQGAMHLPASQPGESYPVPLPEEGMNVPKKVRGGGKVTGVGAVLGEGKTELMVGVEPPKAKPPHKHHLPSAFEVIPTTLEALEKIDSAVEPAAEPNP